MPPARSRLAVPSAAHSYSTVSPGLPKPATVSSRNVSGPATVSSAYSSAGSGALGCSSTSRPPSSATSVTPHRFANRPG